MREELTFRFAERKDTPLILKFIRELADYEKMLDEVVADEKTLEEWIFDRQKAEVLFAVAEGKEVGFALFFHNFSTFSGKSGDLSGRPVCAAGVQGERLRERNLKKTGGHRPGTGLRPPGMVVPGLE